ncbi:hypothetical protein LPJ53_005884, partial [Coemansia erecta]
MSEKAQSVAEAPASLKQTRPDTSSTEKLSVRTANSKADVEDDIENFDKHEKLLDDDDSDDGKLVEDIKAVGVLQLFRFSTPFDRLLTIAGVCFSCAAGVVNPVMIIIFSNLMGVILQYGQYMSDSDVESANHYLDHESRHYCLLFFILGIVMWVVSFGVNACWAVSAENQGLRIRKLYYKSIMRQDIGWFDTIKTGELTTRITNDVNLVQEGLGEKFGFVFMNI